MADTVEDIQTTSGFIVVGAPPAVGGRDLLFTLPSKVAFLSVPVFETGLNLAQFHENLVVKSRRHSKSVLHQNRSAVAAQASDVGYDLPSLDIARPDSDVGHRL